MKNNTATTAPSVSSELQRLRSNRLLMLILSLLLIVAVIWTLLSVFKVQDESEITQRASKFTQQLNPNLDEKVFATLQQKPFYDETQLASFPIYILVRDKAGNYSVVSYDTPVEEIERLTNESNPRPAVPRTTPAPATAAGVPSSRTTSP